MITSSSGRPIKAAAPLPIGLSPITAHGRAWPPPDSLSSTPCDGALSPASSIDDIPPLGPEITPLVRSSLTEKLANLAARDTYPLADPRTCTPKERALGPQAPRALARLPSLNAVAPQEPPATRVFTGDSCSSHPTTRAPCGLPPLLHLARSAGPSSVDGSLSPPESPMSYDTLDQRWWGSSSSSSSMSSTCEEAAPAPMLPLSVLPPPAVDRDAVDLPVLVETLWVGGVRLASTTHGGCGWSRDAGHLVAWARWDPSRSPPRGPLKTRQLLVLLEQRWLGGGGPSPVAPVQQVGRHDVRPSWVNDALEMAPLTSQPMGIVGTFVGVCRGG